MDLYSTYNLILLYDEVAPLHTFLRDRYFPTNPSTDIFSTSTVLAEYREGNKKLAPFVAPRKGSVPMIEQGFNMREFEPPNIAPSRPLTVDEMKRRNFGEGLFSTLTPEQREAILILQDMDYLGQTIARREEAMAAETLLTNGCVMYHIADDATKGEEMEVRFYDEAANPASYTPATAWDASNAMVLSDMAAMARMLTSRGAPATELVVASDVADAILNDEAIYKQLDNKNINVGGIDPAELPDGASKIARLKTRNGRFIDVICYEEGYEDADGNEVPFIAPGHVVLTAPAAGRTLYGAVTQIEQYDHQPHTYPAARVPKYDASSKSNTREVVVTSKPLLIPNRKNPWVSAKVL